MKKTILILAVLLVSICGYSQINKPVEVTFLDGWTFDNDTNLYKGIQLNYTWGLQIEGNSLTGTYDGLVKIYHKMDNFDQWVLYDPSAVDTINDANYSHVFVGDEISLDSIRIELLNNNITGGTIDLKLNLYQKNR